MTTGRTRRAAGQQPEQGGGYGWVLAVLGGGATALVGGSQGLRASAVPARCHPAILLTRVIRGPSTEGTGGVLGWERRGDPPEILRGRQGGGSPGAEKGSGARIAGAATGLGERRQEVGGAGTGGGAPGGERGLGLGARRWAGLTLRVGRRAEARSGGGREGGWPDTPPPPQRPAEDLLPAAAAHRRHLAAGAAGRQQRRADLPLPLRHLQLLTGGQSGSPGRASA